MRKTSKTLRVQSFTHEFVEFIPEELSDGILYVSLEYGSASHLCACGCGRKVVTPITPTDWQLGFNGEAVSLYPSIGNWNFPCRSHYWLHYKRVKWAPQWSDEEINLGRAIDRTRKDAYLNEGWTPKSASRYRDPSWQWRNVDDESDE